MFQQHAFVNRSPRHGWFPKSPEVHKACFERHVVGVSHREIDRVTESIKESEVLKPLFVSFRQANDKVLNGHRDVTVN